MAPSSKYAYLCTSQASKVSTTHTPAEIGTRDVIHWPEPTLTAHVCVGKQFPQRLLHGGTRRSAAFARRRSLHSCKQLLLKRVKAVACAFGRRCCKALFYGALELSRTHLERRVVLERSSSGVSICTFVPVKPSKLSTGSNTWRWHVAAVTSAESL